MKSITGHSMNWINQFATKINTLVYLHENTHTSIVKLRINYKTVFKTLVVNEWHC